MDMIRYFDGIFLLGLHLFVCSAFVPDNRRVFMYGDFILGGLFPIHSKYRDKTCVDIQGQDGIQAMEAMRYSVMKVNEQKILPMGTKLGMIGVDTCESEIVSLDNTLELIDMRINKNTKSEMCPCNKTGEQVANYLIGIIGPASSKLSIPVASLLRLFRISQISYQSTSPELSDKRRFEYFKRTVPSDYFQVKVIADLLRYMHYQYITVVYEDSSYGWNYKEELERLSETGEFCIGISIKIAYGGKAYQNKDVVKSLLEHKNTNGHVVVVLIVRPSSATSLFKAVIDADEEKTFYWIGTDGWAGRSFQDLGVESCVDGAIAVQLLTGRINGFQDYLSGLTVKSNPWLQEYGCTDTDCAITDLEEFGILSYINDAVFAFAYALKDMFDQKCSKKQGTKCPQYSDSLKGGEVLLDAIGKVKFTDSQGREFKFLNHSEGPPRYSILRYHKKKWFAIGNFSSVNGEETKIYIKAKLKRSIYEGPSICSNYCKSGYAKRFLKDSCCWECKKCGMNQYSTGSECISCPIGFRTNTNYTNCTKIVVDYMTFRQPAAIGTLIVSSLGIIICCFVLVIFIINRDTPLVKATDIKLSFILICGLILSYGSSAAFLAKPSITTCGLTRSLLGLCYTLQYATILTKTIRIYRLFQAKSPEKKKFVNSRSSITLTLLLTFFHVLGLTAWIIFDSPVTVELYDDSKGVLICADADNLSYAYSLSYSVALLIACVVFAIKTRKIPDGFKETRFIAICSYTTCIIWLAFASTFFFTNNNTVRVLSLCITLSINSTVSLTVLFLSRIYIILFKPNLNTRERVMTRGKEMSDRSSNCLTANKSVGTDDEGYITRNGLLAAAFSEPNLSPSLQEKEKVNASFRQTVDDTELLNNKKRGTHNCSDNESIPLNGIPSITINDTGK